MKYRNIHILVCWNAIGIKTKLEYSLLRQFMFQFTQLQLCVKTENIVIYGHDLAKLRFHPFGTCKLKRTKRKDSSSRMAHHIEGLPNNVLSPSNFV